jgi:tryptophan synthase beta chain
MRMLGAEVVPVVDGSQTLKDAVNAAIKYWIAHTSDSHYVLGSCLGPHPYPSMNRDFQSVTGAEIAEIFLRDHGKLPDIVVACVGGGSNAMGAFHRFLDEPSVRLIGVEAGGEGVAKRGRHASRLTGAPEARPGILHGYRSIFLQTDEGGIEGTHSISAGLDYPGVGPQLAFLHERGRVEFVSVTDDQAVEAMRVLARECGIIPAFESSHAVAHTLTFAPTLPQDVAIVVHLSGRADKDLHRLQS